MINLMQQGLAVQKMQVEANKRASLTHEEALAIKAQGKIIVHKPAELEKLRLAK